jgi:hypothetical protein
VHLTVCTNEVNIDMFFKKFKLCRSLDTITLNPDYDLIRKSFRVRIELYI